MSNMPSCWLDLDNVYSKISYTEKISQILVIIWWLNFLSRKFWNQWKDRIMIPAPSTSEGSQLLAWLTVILEENHTTWCRANREINRCTSRNFEQDYRASNRCTSRNFEQDYRASNRYTSRNFWISFDLIIMT